MQLGLVTVSGVMALTDRTAIASAGSGVANPNSTGLGAEGGLGWVAGP